MKKLAAVILAAALLLLILPASGDSLYEGVWISVEIHSTRRGESANIDMLVILPAGAAFMVYDTVSTTSTDWNFATEFTWRILPGNGISLTKVGDEDVVRNFFLDENGMLFPSGFPGACYRRVDPDWYNH